MIFIGDKRLDKRPFSKLFLSPYGSEGNDKMP